MQSARPTGDIEEEGRGVGHTRQIIRAAGCLDLGRQLFEEGVVGADAGYVGGIALGGPNGGEGGLELVGK